MIAGDTLESSILDIISGAQSKPFQTQNAVNVDASSNVVAIAVVAGVSLVVAAALFSRPRAPRRRRRKGARRGASRRR